MELPEEFYSLLGKITLISNVCEGLLLHLILESEKQSPIRALKTPSEYKLPTKKSERQLGFSDKIDLFEAVFERDYKEDFLKIYNDNNFIKNLKTFKDIRNLYVHGVPFLNGDYINIAKVSKEKMENGLYATDEYQGYTIQELSEIIKRMGVMVDILEKYVSEKFSI